MADQDGANKRALEMGVGPIGERWNRCPRNESNMDFRFSPIAQPEEGGPQLPPRRALGPFSFWTCPASRIKMARARGRAAGPCANRTEAEGFSC
jgi:hypothetical protein